MIASLVVFVILTLSAGVAHIPLVRDYVLERGRGYLIDKQEIDLEAERLDYNLFAGRSTLTNVTIRAKGSADLPPLFEARRVFVDLSLTRLLTGDFIVEKAEIEGARIQVISDASGRSNLPALKATDEASKPTGKLRVLIAALQASGPAIRWSDEVAQREAILADWRLGVSGDRVGGPQRIEFGSGSSGSLTIEGRSIPLQVNQVMLLHGPEGLMIEDVRASAGSSSVGMHGAVVDLEAPVVDLELEARLDVEELAKFGGQPPAAGQATVEGQLRGPPGALEWNGRIEGRELVYKDLHPAALDADLFWSQQDEVVRFSAVELSSPLGTAAGEGQISLAEAPSRVTARYSGLDLAATSRLIEAPVVAGARASGDFAAEWPGIDFEQLQARGKARLVAIGEAQPNRVPLAGLIGFEKQPGSLTLDINSFSALGTATSGGIRQTPTGALEGVLETSLEDIGVTLTAVRAVRGGAGAETQDIRGSAQVTTRLGGTMDSPSARVELRAPRLTIGAAENVGVTLNAAVDRAAVRIEQLAAEWMGGGLTAAGTATLGESEGDSPGIDFTAQLTGFPLAAAAAVADLGEDQVSGELSMEATFSGTIATPLASLSAHVEELAAYGERWGRADAELRLANDRLDLESFQLQKPGGPDGEPGRLRADGSYDVESKQLRFQTHSDGLRLLGVRPPDGPSVRGMAQLDIEATGSLEDPAVTLELKAQEVAVDEREIGAVELSADYGGGLLRWSAGAADWGAAGEGQLATEAPYQAVYSVTMAETQLGPLLPSGVAGVVTGVVHGETPLEDPTAGVAEAALSSLKVETGGEQIRNAAPLKIGYAERVVSVESFELTSGNATLSVQGSLPLEGEGGDARIQVDGAFNLELVRLLSGKSVDELFLLGLAELNGTIGGSIGNPRPEVTLSLEDAVVVAPALRQPIINADLTARLDDRALTVENLQAEWSRAKIQAQAAVPLNMIPNFPLGTIDSTESASLSAEVTDLDFGTLEIGPAGFGGIADLTAELTAEGLTAGEVQGELNIGRLNLRFRDLELAQTEPTRITFDNGTARIASIEIEGPETQISLRGGVMLEPSIELDLALEGRTDIGVMNYLVEGSSAQGPARFDLAVHGPLENPSIEGAFSLEQGRVALESPPIEAEALAVKLQLDSNGIRIEQFSGELNGGTMQASGSVGLGEDYSIETADLSFEAREIFLEPVDGLQTVSRADIRLHDEEETLLLEGEFLIEDGSFRERIDLGSRLLRAVGGSSPTPLLEEPDPLLSRLRYGVDIKTRNPIYVDNNLAKLEATIDLKLVGEYYRPALLGRVVLEEGGQIELSERQYVLESGAINFTNETQIRPSLNILARTEVAGHDITLRASGEPGDLETDLSSDSGLSQPDIISLLLTGRTLGQAGDSGLNVAGEQALSYIAGGLGGRLSSAAQSGLGLTQVRIEPNLISAEEDPTARLTVGQRLHRKLQLIYSMNLADSGDQILVTEVDVTRRFNTRAVHRQEDNSYRFDLKHDLRFGLNQDKKRRSEKASATLIGKIEFTGDADIDREELLAALDLEPGDPYDFFRTRKRIDKLRRRLREDDRLEAHVRLRRRQTDHTVDLTVEIEQGPRVEFVFTPDDLPDSVKREVRQGWVDGVFEAQRVDDAERALRAWLNDSGFYEARLETSVEAPAPGIRRAAVEVDRGVKYGEAEITFPGASAVEPARLLEVLSALKLRQRLSTRPREVVEGLERYYYQLGYLGAEVTRPDVQLDSDHRTARVEIAVQEGELFHVGEVAFRGANAMSEAKLRPLVEPSLARAYTPEYLQQALQRIEESYWAEGYNGVLVSFVLTPRPEAARVDVEYVLDEKERDMVERIAVEGAQEVGEKFIRRNLAFATDETLTPEKADRSRRKLYRTGAFSLVDVKKEQIEGTDVAPGVRPLLVSASVREVAPYRVRYGAFFDTERGPGAIVDFRNRNTLGAARVLGFRGRYDADFREARGYFSQPLLRGLPLETTAAVFRSRELNADFITDRTGVSVQQEMIFGRGLILQYGYRFEQAHTFDRGPDPFFDITVDVAPLTSSLTLDTRDSILDATRGRFTSHSFEYAPSQLGSDVKFLKYFGQYFDYVSLIGPKPKPFERDLGKPRLLYAGGLRVGLVRGLGGQQVIPSERFFAGGGSTVRGFKQDSLGPVGFFGDPRGGDALFLLNNELRFPVVSIFEGVGFLDMGNVYPTVSDFDPSDLRKSAGLGLRLRTPYFLVRLDYGWKLDRREDESSGGFFFSIGQAF